jgi:hypothetical protein
MTRLFLSTTASRSSLGSIRSPIQRVSGVLLLGVKRPGHRARDTSAYRGTPLSTGTTLSLYSYLIMQFTS